MILDWLRSTAEWRNWGFNALVVCFVATLGFNAFQIWTLARQRRTIVRTRSSASVSVPFFAYMTGLFCCFAVYGVAIDSLAAALNGVLALPYAGVILGVASVRPLSRREKAMALIFPLMAVAMALLPWKDAMMTAVMAVSMLPMAHQAWTMWRGKSAGAVEPRYLAAFTAASAFWLVYGFAAGSTAMMIVNPPAFVIILAIVALWYAYREHPAPG